MAISHRPSLPTQLETRITAETGRGLYALQLVPQGTELLTAQPLAHVVKGAIRSQVCQNCLKKAEVLLRCGGCKYIYYCSKSCQRKDWDLHKIECAGLKKMHNGSPTDTMRLVLRLVTMATTSSSRKQDLDSLISNDGEMSEQVRSDMAVQVMGVVLLLGDSDADRAAVFSILGKVMSNAFNVLDDSYDEVLGLAVYGLPSLLNHSCQPNSIAVFNGSKLLIRTITTLHPGDQVLISYCEVLNSRTRRQTHLQKVYSFLCSCARCQTEECEDSPLFVMYASKNGVKEEERLKTMEEGFTLLDQDLKDLERDRNWSGFVEKCQQFIGTCGEVLHPLNVVLTNVQEQLLRAELELRHWQAALDTGKKLTQAYRHCLPPHHPVYVVHLVKMGKLGRALGSNEHLAESAKELREALGAIAVAFGDSNPLMMEAQCMLEDSVAELARRTNDCL